MVAAGNEQVSGEVRDAEGTVIDPSAAVEIDRMGGVHVAILRLPKGTVAEDQALTLAVEGGRTIELFVLEGGVHPDGVVRAAVVKDTGRPLYGLGLGAEDPE